MAKHKKPNDKAKKKGIDIETCLQAKKDVHRVECGLVFASYILREPEKLKKQDKERIQAGLNTARGMLDRMVKQPVYEPMEKETKKARTAAAKALGIIKKSDKMPKGEELAALTRAVQKAEQAHQKVEDAANALCRKGRD